MTIREALRGVGWLFAAWGIGFTLDLVARANVVSSNQWKYLMSVPGGHYTWVAVFGIGGLTLAYGLAADHRHTITAGYSILGFGCGLIAAFYVAAPLIDTGLTTLGYWPWLGVAILMVILAVVYSKPRPWLQ